MKYITSSFIVFMLFTVASNAQSTWTKYIKNPVMSPGPAGSWDEGQVANPCIIFDNTIYHMWYSGNKNSNANSGAWRVGYATSEDGINWIKYSENPVMGLGKSGSWDDQRIISGYVLSEADSLKMWYRSQDGVFWKTGLAISLDGINWVKYDDPSTTDPPYDESDPVLQPGSDGSWDDSHIYINSVLFDDNIYKCWYHGTDGNLLYRGQIGYATSSDGINWTKYDNPETTDPPYDESDPVLDFGLPGSWDDSDLDFVKVIKNAGIYHMLYNGGNSGLVWQTGYASSIDGIQWTKHNDNPVIKNILGWEGNELNATSVLYQDQIYKAWYWGSDGTARIGYAEDFSNSAHPDSFTFNRFHIYPSQDTVKIYAWIANPQDHEINVRAFVADDDSVFVDSTNMTHQSDGLWQGIYLPEGERIYNVWIKTIDNESGTIHDGAMWGSIKRFSTSGPVKISHYQITSTDTIAGAGDQLKFKIFLKNDGGMATVNDVRAEVTQLEDVAEIIALGERTYGNIAPGEVAAPNRTIQINFNDDCPDNFPAGFKVDVKSGNDLFWSDTFYVVTDIEDVQMDMPKTFALRQNYPNPFNPTTMINYQLAMNSDVELSVYNLLGQKVATLVNKKQPSGTYEVELDASDFVSGVYFYRLETDQGFNQTRKLVVLK